MHWHFFPVWAAKYFYGWFISYFPKEADKPLQPFPNGYGMA